MHGSPFEEKVERRAASRGKINILLFNASSLIVDTDMGMFSRQNPWQRVAAGGRAFPLDGGSSL